MSQDEQGEIEKVIRERLPPEKYGLRQALLGPFYRDNGRTYLLRDSKILAEGWDCGDGALTTSEVLTGLGVNNKICFGRSEDGAANRHFFVVSGSGTIYDPVPMYPFIGARHQILGEMSSKEIKEHKDKNKVILENGQVPVTWYSENSSKYVVVVGKSIYRVSGSGLPDRFSKQIGLLGIKFLESTASFYLEKIAVIDQRGYSEKGFVPQENRTLENSIERMGELRRIDVLRIFTRSFPGIAPAPEDLTQKLDSNSDVFCSLIEGIAHSYVSP